MGNSLGNKLIGIKIHGVSILVVDCFPELLKFFFFKALIQRIIQNLWLIAVLKHLLQ